VHNRHYVHGDVKPSNFLIGTGENRNRIYLIDLGLAKPFRNVYDLKRMLFWLVASFSRVP
jgi:serine/threonine protein kinase